MKITKEKKHRSKRALFVIPFLPSPSFIVVVYICGPNPCSVQVDVVVGCYNGGGGDGHIHSL